MLKVGTPVKIISKSIGVNISQVSYKEGYVVRIADDGNICGYNQNIYYHVWHVKSYGFGDHYLKRDLINLDHPDFFSDKDFEI